MKSFQLKPGQKIPPETQTKSNELILKFIDKGVTKFDDIVKAIRKEFGKETLRRILSAIKSGYTAYLANATDAELKTMDSFEYVRSYKIETGNIRKIQKSNSTIWRWEEAKILVKSLFWIWKYDEDFEWIEKNWNKFSWAYKNKTELIELKIKLFSLANIYYEFCHEAYDMSLEILTEDIMNDDFPYYHIQKLLKKYNLNVDEKSPLYSKVFELIRKFKYHLFEELISAFGSIESVYYELEAIIPTSKAEYQGWEYIMHWGDTYSNFW